MLVNWKHRHNMPRGVSVGGAWIEEPKRVKEAVRQFFRTRFQESPELRPLLDGVDFKTIDQSDNVMLIAPFEEAEVRQLCGNVEAPIVQVQMGSISNSSRNSGRFLNQSFLDFLGNFMQTASFRKEAMHLFWP